MVFDWDPDKARRNRKKQGVSFAEAVEVLSDEYAITRERAKYGEQR